MRDKFRAVTSKDEIEMARILGRSVPLSSITYVWYHLQKDEFFSQPHFTHLLDAAKALKCSDGLQFAIDGTVFEYNLKSLDFQYSWRSVIRKTSQICDFIHFLIIRLLLLAMFLH